MRHSSFLVVSLCVVMSGLAARAWSSLGGVQLDVTSVADSTSYLFYSYTVRNPASSTWGLSAVEVDIGASSGTPDNLGSTGNLFDFTTSDAAQAPHAEVGPSSPSGWQAILSRGGTLTWAAPSSAVQSTDSIAPGGSKSGFAIRSTYLPGTSSVVGLPTVESCCLEPTDSLDGEFIYPGPEQFAASGWTIAPRYMPNEVTLDLLQTQRTAVCTDPLWIDDAPLCTELADSLTAAETRLASGDNTGARTALEGVLAILDTEREPTGPIESNAYWLLRLNTQHVLGSIPVSPQTISSVQFELTSVADSASYHVYSYRLANPPSSAGVTAAVMDVSASSGAPPTLPATGGPFRDWTRGQGSPAPRAEVGPIIPTGWESSLGVTAEVDWYVPVGNTSPDSVSPGDTLSGFGIRSSYLPGLRSMSFDPTVEACCTQPIDTTEERFLGFPEDYAISGLSVGPRYMPSEVTFDLVQSQRTAVCTDPLWIDDAPLCTSLADSLTAAETRLATGDNGGARTALEGVLAILDTEREPTGPIESNAYWLLRLNTEHMLGSIPGAGDVATGSATELPSARSARVRR